MNLDHILPVLDRIRETQLGQTGALRDMAEAMEELAQHQVRLGQELRTLRREHYATRLAVAQIPTSSSQPPPKRGSKIPWALLFEEGEKRLWRVAVAVFMLVHLLKGGDPIALIKVLFKPL